MIGQINTQLADSSFNLSILECKLNEMPPIACVQQCFNLSILECKSSCTISHVLDSSGFNLSILECKCSWCSKVSNWRLRFNLSILECKYFLPVSVVPIAAVLIYPYWNVNEGIELCFKNTSEF